MTATSTYKTIITLWEQGYPIEKTTNAGVAWADVDGEVEEEWDFSDIANTYYRVKTTNRTGYWNVHTKTDGSSHVLVGPFVSQVVADDDASLALNPYPRTTTLHLTWDEDGVVS